MWCKGGLRTKVENPPLATSLPHNGPHRLESGDWVDGETRASWYRDGR